MAIRLKVGGFEGIEKALLELPRSTARGTVRRVLKKELKPVAAMANSFWPGAQDPFEITSKLDRGQFRDSTANFSKNVVNMFVGGAGVPHLHLLEFGTGPRWQNKTGRYTGQVAPAPMLQPAWDAHRRTILEGLGAQIWDEIQKTQARRAKRAAKKAK